MKTRRVGSITCGLVLILFGALFLAHFAFPSLNYWAIFRVWPCILIVLGLEVLLSCKANPKGITIKYDGAAIFLLIVMVFFAMGMGVLELLIEHCPEAIWGW